LTERPENAQLTPVKSGHVPERVVLGFEDLGIRDVTMLGSYAYSRAHPPLRPHVHPNVFEVCFLQRGAQSYQVGSQRYDLTGGDLMMTRPGEVHGTGHEPESPGKLFWLQFRRAAAGRGFLGLSPREAALLMKRFDRLPGRYFRHADMLAPTFERILTLCARRDDPLLVAEVRNLLLRLILDVVALAEHRHVQLPSPSVRRALLLIEERLDEPLNVRRLAQAAGMSESHFKMLFRRQVGLPPMEYAATRRMEKAKLALQSSAMPVTELAHSLGFATSQHFATVFKRLTGHTPSAYRLRSRTTAAATSAPASGIAPRFHPVDETG
jgi:AraC-like DNA-binding protein